MAKSHLKIKHLSVILNILLCFAVCTTSYAKNSMKLKEVCYLRFYKLEQVPSQRNMIGDIDTNPEADESDETANGNQMPAWKLQEWTKQVTTS